MSPFVCALGVSLVGGLCATSAAQTTLEFDPMLGWVTINGGVGQGRSAYFTCDEDISLTSAGFFCDMTQGLYEVQIYQGVGEFLPAGPLLHGVTATLGGIGLNWQDAKISFDLKAGQDYILHFRSATVGATVANAYQRFFWGDGAGEDLDLGVVTIRDGREGYDPISASNVAFPRTRIEYTSGAGCYADCDASGSLDFFDFLCFQNEFAAGSAYADCDASGSLDFFDFLCFQNEFAAGCP